MKTEKGKQMDWANIIITAGSVIVAVGVIVGAVKKLLDKALDPMQEQIKEMDKRECRLHLIQYLTDIERGIEKDEVQHIFAHELFDHYTKELKGNSYVLDKWNKVMKQ